MIDSNKRADIVKYRLPQSRLLFETPRLEFRTPSESDVYKLAELWDISDCVGCENCRGSDVDNVRKILMNGTVGANVIVRKNGGYFVGAVRFYPDGDNPRRVMLDFVIVSEYRERDYISEALDGFVNHLFSNNEFDVISIQVPVSRKYIVKTCNRCGFEIEGIKRFAS